AVRARREHDRPWEPIYVGTFERAYAERLLAEGRWSPAPDALVQALEQAEDVDLELAGRTHEIAALDLSADPGLRAVMDQTDPAIRSDEAAARRSDQEAVEALLNDGEIEPEPRNDKGGDGLADLQADAGAPTHETAAAHQTSSGDEPRPAES